MEMIIEWGPERKHDGSGECPADARDVPCIIKGPEWELWRTVDTHTDHTDKVYWPNVTAYRLPAAVPAPAPDLVRDALPATIIVRMAQTKDDHIAIRNTDLDDENLGACLIPIEHIDALIAALPPKRKG